MKMQPESEKVLSNNEVTELNENVLLHLYRTISIIALQMVNVRAARQHRLVPYSLRLLSNNFYSERVYITQFTDSCGKCSIYYNWQKSSSVSGVDSKQQTIPSSYVHDEYLKGGAVLFVGYNDVTITAMDDNRLKIYPGMYGEIHIPIQNRKKTIGVLSFDTMQRRIIPNLQLLRPMKIAALLLANILILNQEQKKNSGKVPFNDPCNLQEISSLQKMVTVKNRLISTVSHELRTPLTGIIGLTQALRMSGVSLTEEEKDTFLGIIENEGKRLAALIRDLLDMSVSEIDGVKLSLSKFSLKELISEIAMLMDNSSGKSEIITQLNNEIIIHADKDRIKQVIIILLDNALKHGGNRCTITASLDNKEKCVVVRVTDNGQGILPEDQKRVFESFYTTGSLRRKKPESTGLGLSIAKKIIESHGGNIWVESIPGNGCTFLISIPT